MRHMAVNADASAGSCTFGLQQSVCGCVRACRRYNFRIPS